ncbi:MAG: EAL domain-containing protein, partial [Oscillospiraceae bacterium]
KLIEIELTESTMLYKENVLVEMLGHLHEHGFMLSMDDFGSGYSSLGLLKNLPVDTIKLDKTFFAEYCDKARAKTVTASMISMAKQLGTETVAEGVETLEQVQLLTELGCDIVQGYYFARPMPTEELKKILIAREEKNV